MTIRKRRLFYLHGFDPRGARHYLSLYRDQAEKQQHAEDVHYRIETEEAVRSRLNIRFTENDQTTETTYQFLSWDDMVSEYMKTPLAGVLADTIKAIPWYWQDGFRLRCRKASKGMYVSLWLGYLSLLVPVAATALALLLTLIQVMSPLSLVLALTAISLIYIRLNRRYNLLWLLRSFNFNYKIGNEPDLFGLRMTEMADIVEASLRDGDYDEAMLVNHCFGSSLINMLLAELASRPAFKGRQLSVVTLAQVSPALLWTTAWYPTMPEIADTIPLVHVDYSSPADGVCFPFFRLKPESDQLISQLRSPKFHTLFDEKKYRRIIKKNKLRVHFQYLMASDYPANYDFFRLTAGPESLLESIRKYQDT